MIPPKPLCSAYAEILAMKAALLTTIADIRAAVSKVVGTKNKLLYGLIVVDVAASEIVASATTFAATIAAQVLTNVTAFTASLIEAALAPLLKILLTGPEAVFSLVNLPLQKAIKANDTEAYYLSKAKAHFDLVVSIFSKWTSDLSGGKYANQMREALPYITDAIKQCAAVIGKLEADEDLGVTAQFDEQKYNAMRSNLTTAIEITEQSPLLLNKEALDRNIERAAENIYSDKVTAIMTRYRLDKKKLAIVFLDGDQSPAKITVYSAALRSLDSKKKIDIDKAKMNATNEAILDGNTYAGILNNKGDEFLHDFDRLGYSLRKFGEYLSKAYVQYKGSQALTYSTYSIESLINTLIESMIKLMGKLGNGAGAAVQGPLRYAKELMSATEQMYFNALNKYYSPEESVSSTALASKLSAGNGLLIIADSVLAASITQSMIDLINSDEALTAQRNNMNKLFENIENIPDWDGTLAVWGVDPTKAVVAPYPSLISGTLAIISSLLTTGLVADAGVLEANRKRITAVARVFRTLLRHNSDVNAALRIYAPPINPYIEEFLRAVPPDILNLFIAGPAAFNTIMLIKGLAKDKGDPNVLDMDGMNFADKCIVSYPDLFTGVMADIAKAKISMDSMRKPPQFNNTFSAKLESKELDQVEGRYQMQNTSIPFDDSDVSKTD